MSFRVFITLHALCVLTAFPDDVQELAQAPSPVTKLPLAPNSETFQFAIVTDRTGGLRPGVFEEAVAKLNLLQPGFVMSIGDLIEGNANSEPELVAQWDEFDAMLHKLDPPFFYVPGNHDVSNTEWGQDVWKRRYGPLYYHFVHQGVLFLCLNSDDDRLAHFGDEQIHFAESILAQHKDARYTFVFFHKPVWTYEEDSGWDRIEAALGQRPYTVFTGHTHEYLKYDRNGRDYFVLGTTGGGQAHEGPVAGEFDHIVWVTMRDEGPEIANIMLDGIAGKDIRNEQTARLAAPILDGRAVISSPVFVDGPFTAEEVELNIVNEGELPMRAEGMLHPTNQLRAAPGRLSSTVAPGDTAKHVIALTSNGSSSASDIQPLVTTWRFTYDIPNREALVVLSHHALVVELKHDCVSVPNAPAIDGSLADWNGLPIACLQPSQIVPRPQNWEGTGDCSFRFGVTRDDEYVYIAVEVVDDVVIAEPGIRPWKQDGIEIRLDARPEEDRSSNRGEADRDQTHHLYVGLSPGNAPNESLLFEPEKLPEGFVSACMRMPDGYAVEMALPVAYITRMSGGSWDAFRVNVTANDYDSVVDIGTALWWRPDWSSAENVPGSGTFGRE